MSSCVETSLAFGGVHSCFGGGNAGALRVHVGRRLHAFQAQQDVAFFDVVALFHHDFGDFADSFAEHICVGERLDFA